MEVRTSLPGAVHAEVDASLAPVDADLALRYPGDPGGRQPVHTVYVPADVFGPGTVREWGRRALAALDEHAPGPAVFARVLGLPEADAAEVYGRVRAKLAAEPVEDLRIDFEDGYGPRPDDEEDRAAVRAAALVAELAGEPGAPPFTGVRIKGLQAAVRARGIRTLDVFLTALASAGGLPPGLAVTLPKVTHPGQVRAMARLCEGFERSLGLPEGRIRFEIQIETTQAVLGADGRATVARFIGAARGRVSSLHYGTFDYSAACGVGPAHQSPDHPAADHAKAVMQAAAAGTGVRLSDGSVNILPVGPRERVHAAWRLHHDLVRRSLVRAYYQGWDMHPGHLPTRYAAVYGFYRVGLESAAARLAACTGAADGSPAGPVGGTGGADAGPAGGMGGTSADPVGGPGGPGGQRVGGTGGADAGRAGVLDEPATARALSGHLLRGLDCGALDPDEVEAASGLDRARLDALAGRAPAR